MTNDGAKSFLTARITAQREAHAERRLRWIAVQVFVGGENDGGPLREERAADRTGVRIQTQN